MMIKRLYRQHKSTVLTIPKPVLSALELEAGDYVEIEVRDLVQEIRISKVEGRAENVRKNEDGKSKHDRGG